MKYLKYNQEYQSILETLDKPSIINWTIDSHSMRGKFYVNREKYVILSKTNPKCEDINSWNFKFYWNDGGDIIYSLSNLGAGKFKVMATIVEGFKNLMEIKKPDSIIFSANLEEDSRVKLYNRLMEEAISTWGFKLNKFPHQSGDSHLLTYILYKNESELGRLKTAAKSMENRKK